MTQFDRPDLPVRQFKFTSGGRWVTAIEGRSVVLVYSAEDGRLLSRLRHPVGEVVNDVVASPAGRRVAAVIGRPGGGILLRMWDTASWSAEPGATNIKDRYAHFEFITEDLFACGNNLSGECELDRIGQAERITRIDWPSMSRTCSRGELIHVGDGRVFDTATGQRLRAPVGRKFHPDLARFAPDGRFVGAFVDKEYVLIDPRTDKYFRAPQDWREMPGFGMVAAVERYGVPVELRFMLSADRLDLPQDLLELWAQVAVRGEIGPDGSFVKWDEPTWERKRQELAAWSAPWPDFPFPGHVAADRLHWLRKEYESASDADKPRLAKELLDRAEAAGDKAEAARWRAKVKQP